MAALSEVRSSISVSAVHLLSIASLATLSYFFLVALYRVTLHPLARYPGPFLAKITSWRDVYHAYTGDKHLDLHNLHERHGPFVRYGPNTLSINHPAGLKAIYSHKANVRKSDFYLSFYAAPGVFSTHTALDIAAHARKRRVMSHAFSEAALKGVENYVLNHVRLFIEKLAGGSIQGQWTEGRDVSTWATYLGFDTMGDLSFGKSFRMLQGDVPENREAAYLLTQAAKRHNVAGPMPWLHQSGLDRILLRKINQDRDRYLAFSRKQVGERTKSDVYTSDRKDFFYYLLNSKDPETGQGFGKAELWGESNTLIIAGSDTTSTTLTGTIFYLLHNQFALDRLNEEIRSTFDSVENIRSGPTLNSCFYLRACIDEAMRMSPPVGAILPRMTLAGGIEVLGHRIPAEVGVGSPIYALHHNSEFVPDSFSYLPERWIVGEAGTTVESLAKLQSVFNPFSIGPRGCIGKPMAYLEISLTLARLVWQYDMRLTSGEKGRIGEGRKGLGTGRERPNEFQLIDIFVSEKEGPIAEFRPREKQN